MPTLGLKGAPEEVYFCYMSKLLYALPFPHRAPMACQGHKWVREVDVLARRVDDEVIAPLHSVPALTFPVNAV